MPAQPDTRDQDSSAWSPTVAVATWPPANADPEPLLPGQSYTRLVPVTPAGDWASLAAAIPPEAEVIYLIAPGSSPTHTAVECALWAFDSHPQIGFLWGAGADGAPTAFRPAEFLKNPRKYGPGLFLRREILGRGRSPEEAVATAIGRGHGGMVLATPTETPAWSPRERPPDCPDLLALAAAAQGEAGPPPATPQPRHDRFRSVPLHTGPAAPPAPATPRHAAFLVPHFAMGGADKFNLDLARTLAQDHGYRVSFISTLSKESDWEPAFREISEDLYPLQKFLTRPDFPRFLATHINSRGAQLAVVAHSTLAYQCLPYLREACPQTQFVDYLHIVEEGWREGGYPGLSCQYGSCLDHSFTSSENLQDWLLARGKDPQKAGVLTTNIDPQQWDPATVDAARIRRSHGVPDGHALILFAGRLTAQKQPEVVAATLAALEADPQLPPFTCLVAGEGEGRGTLEEAIRKGGLSSARLLGQVDSTGIRDLLAAADIFFLPSRNEGIALALFEAMAMGCPVVGAEVGGQAELVDAECGVLVDPTGGTAPQAAAYAAAIAPLLADPQRRAQMAAAARRRIEEHFTLRQMGEKFAATVQALPPRAQEPPLPTPLLHAHLDEVIEGFRLEQELYRLGDAAARLQKLEAKETALRDQLLAAQLRLAQSPDPVKEDSAGGQIGNRIARALRGRG